MESVSEETAQVSLFVCVCVFDLCRCSMAFFRLLCAAQFYPISLVFTIYCYNRLNLGTNVGDVYKHVEQKNVPRKYSAGLLPFLKT